MMYGGQTSKQELEDIQAEEEQLMLDPYMKKKQRLLTPQQFRTVKVGNQNLLKNGQMIQVNIADAFDPELFHATDKVLLLKHEDKFYALGSFCGYCYSNLGQGALLGEKLCCAECGSNYDVTSGFVETGPNFRNLSTFAVKVRKDQIELTVPEHIPPFSKKRFIKRELIDPRTIVVLGDDETALAVVDGLRTSFTGRIVIIPLRAYGLFENVEIMKR